jgi:hypothetical protein
MIAANHPPGRSSLSPAELVAAMRNGLEARRQVVTPPLPPPLPAPPGGDPAAPLWPLGGLLGHPTPPARPGVVGAAFRLLRRGAKKLVNPWLDHQTRFNHQFTAAFQHELAAVFEHLRLLNQRLNEVTGEQLPALRALEQRVNECWYEASQARAERREAAPALDAARAAEDAFLQTRMPDPPGRAVVLAHDGPAPAVLAALGYAVLTTTPDAAADLPLKDGSVRLAVALDHAGSTVHPIWSEVGRPVREALARALARNGRVIGSLRVGDRPMTAPEIAAVCAPLRPLEVSHAAGVALWSAA